LGSEREREMKHLLPQMTKKKLEAKGGDFS
jgi:hypothetical protein